MTHATIRRILLLSMLLLAWPQDIVAAHADDLGSIVLGRCNGEPGVYLYSASNHHGRCTRFTASARRVDTEYVGDDTASSVRMVGAYNATVYPAVGFGGQGTTFTAADSTFGNDPIGHDRVESLRVRPSHQLCGSGVGVFLYEGTGFVGRCSRFTSSVGDLATTRVGDNVASSIRLLGGYQADVFEGSGAMGDSSHFSAPADPNFGDDAIGHDRASSIRVAGPYPEPESVNRVQVRLVTADVGDAGTDDSVLVSLNQDNFTWVDYGRDDFQRGDAYTYDLVLKGVSRFESLKWLTVSKTGSDGWCVNRIEVKINGKGPLFQQRFSPCRWLDNGDSDRRSLAVSFDGLRSGQAWSGYPPPVPVPIVVLTADEVESRIASMVGHALHGTKAAWRELGSNAVKIGAKSDHAIHVVVKLFARVPYVPDPNVDVHFDLELSCTPGSGPTKATINVRMTNLDTDVDFPNDGEILFFLKGIVGGELEDSIPNLGTTLGLPTSQCPTITVRGDGQIQLSPPEGG
jgi:hypothetical protein